MIATRIHVHTGHCALTRSIHIPANVRRVTEVIDVTLVRFLIMFTTFFSLILEIYTFVYAPNKFRSLIDYMPIIMTLDFTYSSYNFVIILLIPMKTITARSLKLEIRLPAQTVGTQNSY